MNQKILILLFSAAVLVLGLSACSEESAIGPANLGTSERDIIVGSAAGVYDLDIHTNHEYHVEIIGEGDWLDITTGNVEKNLSVASIKYEANDGFARMVRLVLVSDYEEPMRDTILFRQRAGRDPVLRFDDLSAVRVPGGGGVTETPIVTNIPIDELAVEIEYVEQGDKWLTSLDINVGSSSVESTLKITSSQNTGDTPRSATVAFSFVDGWGASYSATAKVLQANKDESYFIALTFPELRSQYATGGTIADYVGISGIVVSNKEQGNAGCPIQLNKTTIDYTPMEKTIYFEDENAQYGIAILVDYAEDNIFDQFDRVTLMLQGSTLTKKGSGDDCPVRYELTDFDPSMVFSRTSGEDAPVKHRTIGELTDDDMFTYVSLDNVQFPMRKGALFPVFGTFYEATNVQKCTKYPMLVIDREGNDLYLLTNSKCLYHRDGTRLPYGSGSLHGVVTHEHFSRFEWAGGLKNTDIQGYYVYNDSTIEDYKESIGNIGRYQLRHQTKDDIWGGDMDDDFEDGDFKLLTEFRWRAIVNVADDAERNLPTNMGDSIDVATYGKNGWLTHTYQTKYTGTPTKNESADDGTHITLLYASYDYLGPIGNSSNYMYGKNHGNKNGCGIIVDEAKEEMSFMSDRFAYNRDGIMEYSCEYSENANAGYGRGGWLESYSSSYQSAFPSVPNGDGESNSGTGRLSPGNYAGFGHGEWWDYDTNTPYGYLVGLSTADVSSASVVAMQFGIRAVSEQGFTPRYWTVEWTDTDPAYGVNVTWHPISDFTVQDQGRYDDTTIWSCNAAKGLNFKLDSDILGKENVYVFIHPTSDKCSDLYGSQDYDSSTLSEHGTYNCSIYLTYFAIRYR